MTPRLRYEVYAKKKASRTYLRLVVTVSCGKNGRPRDKCPAAPEVPWLQCVAENSYHEWVDSFSLYVSAAEHVLRQELGRPIVRVLRWFSPANCTVNCRRKRKNQERD